jgi:SNF2 family DNA or RNA helicase
MIMSLILKSMEKTITDDKENKSSTGNTYSSSVICLSSDGEEESNPPTQASSHRETTLVVAPLSLISQWEEELATKTSLSHHVHYGDSSKTISNFQGIDVVVTTCK